MNTGDFDINQNSSIISILFPVVIVLFVNTGTKLVNELVKEKHEVKIDQILDLQGRNDSVDFLYHLIIFATISLPLTLLIAIICNLILFSNVGVLVTFFSVFFFGLEMTLINLIFKYGFGYVTGRVLNFIFVLTLLFVGILMSI